MILGKLCCLRPLERDDLARLVKWRNWPDIFPWFFSDLQLAESEQERWYEKYLVSGERMWIIEPKTRKAPIGSVALVNIDRHHQSAEMAQVMVAEPGFRNQGICTDAVRTITAFAFEEMNLHRIYIRTLAMNEAAVALYRAAGFATEGIEREAIWKAGAFRDVILMSILRGERE